MKKPFYFKGLIALLFFIFTFQISAQSVQNVAWPNGYYESQFIFLGEEFQDSLFMVFHGEKLPLLEVVKVSFFRKSDLTIKSEFIVDTVDLDTRLAINFLTDSLNKAYLVIDQSENLQEKTKFYKLNGSYDKANKIFEINTPAPFEILNIDIINQSIYMLRANTIDPDYYFNVVLYKYDLQGNLIKSRVMSEDSLDNSNWDSLFTHDYSFGPYQHPGNPNSIVYGSNQECRVIVVDKNSLKMKTKMNIANFGFDYNPKSNTGYGLWPGKITCSGTATHYNGDFNNPKLDLQFYYVERDWNGNILHVRDFGPDSVDNRSYAYTHVQNPESHIIAGSVPFDNFMIAGAEYRQVVIYQFTNQGIGDSIVLFGNKNHVPMQLFADANSDDLFMMSVYNEAWTTNEQFIQLTKIPGFALNLVKERKISPAIYVYPNPAVKSIRLNGYEMGIEKIEIYNQTGVKLFEESNPPEEIDVSQLNPNIYVVLLTNRKGEVSSSLLQKQ